MASAIYLTIPEAKREIRGRIGRQVRRGGGTLQYREVGPCWGVSARRVRCDYYYEATGYDDYGEYDFACEGVMQVTETARSYSTRAVASDCDVF